MKITIELGFSHIRDSLVLIGEKIASTDDPRTVSLQHLRDSLMQGLSGDLQKLVTTQTKRTDIVRHAREVIAEVQAGNTSISSALGLADELTRELVAGCDCFYTLLGKWAAHHYRPTLRGDIDARCTALADLYDFLAARMGVKVTAYRG